MARHREGVKGLKNARYVLMQPAGVFGDKPMLLLYLPEGSDPPYVVADLKGRGLTWPRARVTPRHERRQGTVGRGRRGRHRTDR